MPRYLPCVWTASFWLTLGALADPLSLAAEPAKIDFNRDIKPILSNTCFFCHGPDAAERKGGTDGLRLDLAAGATMDLGGYAAIVPGDPEKSQLIARMTSSDPDEAMPPPGKSRRLSPREIELLKQWIREGAHYASHWSYAKPVRLPAPAVKLQAWPRHEIDSFILSRLEREGLKPAPEADRYALVRRLSLDLTGLPPTLEEVDAFVADDNPQAYESLVDRLLAKPAYGEHWAHMWLDLARYADSAGYADDPSRTIWLFRDYVIRSLNANKPFDQFTVEQIAGDLLPHPTDEQLTATAFHRNTLTNSEGGTNDEEFRNVAVVDRVNTTMAVWMGTTIMCAQCHNHKYDPLSQEEFFRLFAFFNETEDADRKDETPLLSIYADEQRRQRSGWESEIAALEQVIGTPTAALQASQARWDAAFPRQFSWRYPKPAAAKSQAGLETQVTDDGAVVVLQPANNNTYTVELPLEAGTLSALQLEALPHDKLPGKGPGHAAGSFIITGIGAVVTPPAGLGVAGRYVRVELPGKRKMLSLAEVQAFRGTENLALLGEASQSSTAFDGPARLAIDGTTDGRFQEAKSTTHTEASDNPWWEVDLKSTEALDRIVVWNRTDGNVGERLASFRVLVLNEKREPVWQETVVAAPTPSVDLRLSGRRAVGFTQAIADYTQTGFNAADLLDPPSGKKEAAAKKQGWAIGGQTGKRHTLTLIAATPLAIDAGSSLTVTIEQGSKTAGQTLGHFRLSVTGEAGVAEYTRVPTDVVAALQTGAEGRTPAEQTTIARYYLTIAPELQAPREQLAKLQKMRTEQKALTVPVMRELPPDKGRVTKIQHRGNFLDLGKDVTPGTPAAFPPLPADGPRNRLALARWLVDDDNPLTARVIANRYWEQIFGIGIVSTSEEFGSQGDVPFHPELLDWLATELVRLKWDTKAMLRLLMTSAAYRQSSRVTPELQQLDPENRLLARGPRFRISAEMVRDQALAVSGLLSGKMYGEPVKPAQPTSGLNAAFGAGIDWQTSKGEDGYRRALYTTWRRSNPYPSMATFDVPNREVCTVRRVRTNTPLQALVTLNDPVYFEAAQALAGRMMTHGGSNPQDRARYGFRLCLARPPHDAELHRLVQLYEQAQSGFTERPADAKKLITLPQLTAPGGLNVSELAAWTVVGNVLLNLDETFMKR